MTPTLDLTGVAEQYRAEGYEVTLHPSGDQVPPFAAPFYPDILARKGPEHVLVRVKEGQEDLQRDEDASRMAEVVNSQPGWRFDLVVLNGESHREKGVEEAAEPSLESLLHTLDSVERLAESGDTAAAFLTAWASLEAAMRRAARGAGLGVEEMSPRYLLGALYANGLLEREEYDELTTRLRLRNSLIHGLEVPLIASGVPLSVAGAARKLLTSNVKEQPV
jgi:hypothetical protein